MPFYALSRSLNLVTGDRAFDTSRSSWALGHPSAELIAAVLRTPKGSAARDPEYGIDLTGLDNARTNAKAIATNAIRNALKKYVEAKRFEVRRVTVDVVKLVTGTRMEWSVEFLDPRDGKRTVSGTTGVR